VLPPLCLLSFGSLNAVDAASVEMLDQRPNEGHLLTNVIEEDLRIFRLAAKTVRSHDHRQITRVHLCDLAVLGRGKFLQHKRNFKLRTEKIQVSDKLKTVSKERQEYCRLDTFGCDSELKFVFLMTKLSLILTVNDPTTLNLTLRCCRSFYTIFM